MPRRLDDLFSPERLRERWQDEEPGDTARPAEARPLPAGHPAALAERVEQLLAERFPGRNEPALRALVERLRRLVGQRFGADAERGAEADDAAAEQEIGELLTKIEDLAEAMELKGRGR